MAKDRMRPEEIDAIIPWEVVGQTEKPMEYWRIEQLVKHLEGEVLTIADASYADPDQKKAIKDLIKGKFSSKLSWIFELCGYPENPGGEFSRPSTQPEKRRSKKQTSRK